MKGPVTKKDVATQISSHFSVQRNCCLLRCCNYQTLKASRDLSLSAPSFSTSARNDHWQLMFTYAYHTYNEFVCDERSDQTLEFAFFPSNPQNLHASMHLSASAGCAQRKQRGTRTANCGANRSSQFELRQTFANCAPCSSFCL